MKRENLFTKTMKKMEMAFWASETGTGDTIKICKKCSAVSPEKLEEFAGAKNYRTKYGCIGKCKGSCSQDKAYIGLRNGEIVRADSEKDFFEQLNEN